MTGAWAKMARRGSGRMRTPGSTARLGRRADRARRALSVLLLALLAAPAGAAAAGPTATATFAGGFAAGPVNAGAYDYYSWALSPGAARAGAVRVTNLASGSQAVVLYAAAGVTSPLSGDAYVGQPGTCASAGCWLSGLPRTVTLARGQSETVAFTARVPRGTRPGQYLAGIAVRPANPPRLAPSRRAGARSLILHQVTVGVAVTVGSGYASQLDIPAVTGTVIGDQPGIALTERNLGASFEHPAGAAMISVASAGSRAFTVRSGTVLPGGLATLRVITSGLGPGAYPARVALHYDNGAKTAYWGGVVTIPRVASVATAPVGPGGRLLVALPDRSSTSTLSYVLAGAGALALAALLFFLVLGWRRRRWERQRVVAVAGPQRERAPAGERAA